MPERFDDEISLRDILEVINKGKVFIIGVFSFFVLASLFLGLLAPRRYEARALLMVTPSKLQHLLSPSEISLDPVESRKGPDSLAYTISISTHKELLMSEDVLGRVIRVLGLVGEDGEELSIDEFASRLDIERKKDTNIIELTARAEEPQVAREMANIWADEYIDYTNSLITGEVKGTGQFIAEQYELTLKELEVIEQDINEFENNNNLDLIKKELEAKKNKYISEQKELLDIDIKLRGRKHALEQLKGEFEQQEKFIEISKAITDDALWQIESRGGTGGEITAKRLVSETLNPVYQDLEKRIVDTRIEIGRLSARIKDLASSLERTEEEINELKKEVNLKETELIRLRRKLNVQKKAYDLLAGRVKESEIMEASRFDEVRRISAAVNPRKAISRNLKRNLAVAGLIGLMIGLFGAFASEAVSGEEKGPGGLGKAEDTEA